MKNWFRKWSAWEFWPMWLAVAPIVLMYAWFAARARHLFFFSNVNPAIPLAGAVGESKMDILRLLPPKILPKTVFAPSGQSFEKTLAELRQTGIGFPLLAKPDVGERGFLVKKCADEAELRQHLAQFPIDFIVQEFLELPVEMTVLFHRFPGTGGRFGITSVCEKEFLAVRGDGRATVRELMSANVRAAFQLPRFEAEFPDVLEKIPAAGERVLLEPIGNHCRGTKFLNANQHIDSQLIAAFEPICRRIEGVFYGRFDLKCESPEALKNGEFKVMELNGVLGEPAHVYDPAFGMRRAYRDFYRHWRLIFDLHRAALAVQTKPTTHRAAFQFIGQYFEYKRRLG